MSFRQPRLAQCVKEVIEVLLVPVLECAVPIRLPVLEPAARKGSHIGLCDPEELLEHCLCFLQASGVGVARRKPATHLIDGIASLPQCGDRLLIAMGSETGDAPNPWHPPCIEGIEPLSQVDLLDRSV